MCGCVLQNGDVQVFVTELWVRNYCMLYDMLQSNLNTIILLCILMVSCIANVRSDHARQSKYTTTSMFSFFFLATLFMEICLSSVRVII